MARLSQEFYTGDTVEIARQLLGKILVRVLDGETLAGRITETEAYIGRCDKACHAYNYRRTPRTATLFGPPGRAYIYLIYGMYHCLNFVTEPVAAQPGAPGRHRHDLPSAFRRQALNLLPKKELFKRTRQGV